MDRRVMDYLVNKMDHRRDYRQSTDFRRSDYEDSRKGRGSVDFEGSMDFNESKHSERWGDEEYYDSKDRGTKEHHGAIRLTKSDMLHWKRQMLNEDGTRGPHYDMQQIMSVAEKMRIKFDTFDEREFCTAVNMMYSDYCKVVKNYIAPDKELMFFAELAKAFLDDEDGPEAFEKLALYYYCIVDA